jgi:hypothetical protein
MDYYCLLSSTRELIAIVGSISMKNMDLRYQKALTKAKYGSLQASDINRDMFLEISMLEENDGIIVDIDNSRKFGDSLFQN